MPDIIFLHLFAKKMEEAVLHRGSCAGRPTFLLAAMALCISSTLLSYSTP